MPNAAVVINGAPAKVLDKLNDSGAGTGPKTSSVGSEWTLSPQWNSWGDPSVQKKDCSPTQ
eukprot:2855055-Karenia_brevis.AAC.1